MPTEQSGLFPGFDLHNGQQSIHLVTAVLVELSRGQNPYIGPAPKPLTAEQRDTVNDLAQRLCGNNHPFHTYFTTFMNNVVGLNDGRHFVWSDEQITDAIRNLDRQIAGYGDLEVGEINESFGVCYNSKVSESHQLIFFDIGGDFHNKY